MSEVKQTEQPIKVLDVSALQQQLAAAQRARIEACGKEIVEVLKRHGCRLVAEPKIDRGMIVAVANIEVVDGR